MPLPIGVEDNLLELDEPTAYFRVLASADYGLTWWEVDWQDHNFSRVIVPDVDYGRFSTRSLAIDWIDEQIWIQRDNPLQYRIEQVIVLTVKEIIYSDQDKEF